MKIWKSKSIGMSAPLDVEASSASVSPWSCLGAFGSSDVFEVSLLRNTITLGRQASQDNNKERANRNNYVEATGTVTLIRVTVALRGLKEVCLGSFSTELFASARPRFELRIIRPKTLGC